MKNESFIVLCTDSCSVFTISFDYAGLFKIAIFLLEMSRNLSKNIKLHCFNVSSRDNKLTSLFYDLATSKGA